MESFEEWQRRFVNAQDLSWRRTRSPSGRALRRRGDPAHVPVAEAGREVAAVIAGERPANPDLGSRSACAIKTLRQQVRHGGDVLTRIECLFEAETESCEISCVDLRETDAEVDVLSRKGTCGDKSFGPATGLSFKHAGDNADRVRVECALDLNEGQGGCWMHRGCTRR